jgi:hypothetical protein
MIIWFRILILLTGSVWAVLTAGTGFGGAVEVTSITLAFSILLSLRIIDVGDLAPAWRGWITVGHATLLFMNVGQFATTYRENHSEEGMFLKEQARLLIDAWWKHYHVWALAGIVVLPFLGVMILQLMSNYRPREKRERYRFVRAANFPSGHEDDKY